MGSSQPEPDKKRGFLLTEQGRRRFCQSFRDRDGRRRSFDSVAGLDHRTVSKVYNSREPVNLTSIQDCFDACGLDMEPGDIQEYVLSPSTERDRGRATPQPDPVPEEEEEADLYIARAADAELSAALRRRDSTILIKGPHQTGKSSLLGRGLAQARQNGTRTWCTDISRLSTSDFASLDSLCLALCRSLAARFQTAEPESIWRSHWPTVDNMDAYLRDEILQEHAPRLIWALDDLDRLFACTFREDIFRIFRGWHNMCSHEPDGPWSRLTLILVYSVEATLLISNLHESPFNVATPVELEDLTREDVAQLNAIYDSPLRNAAEEEELYALLGGHPHLVRLALSAIRPPGPDLKELKRHVLADGGIYRSYLERLRRFIVSDAEQEQQVRAVLRGERIVPSPESDRSFHTLRSAGVLVGASAQEAAFRCELYRAYLARHLR